jgi:hypothetical protein
MRKEKEDVGENECNDQFCLSLLIQFPLLVNHQNARFSQSWPIACNVASSRRPSVAG